MAVQSPSTCTAGWLWGREVLLTLQAELSCNYSQRLLCFSLGCLSAHPTVELMCVRMCVPVRMHLTDLKQVCKTRLPPQLKGCRAAGDFGGQGEGNICSKQNSASC